ncbi:hypothetical protein M427DRAFT_49282 [Gonapodya prolifera JEL478]|uniref:Uncharacterized protein n=1 Tax=Gonapodya prolifera (strain JEL478) TaxID=1344416 RepID=A0A138ZZ07_GONPJ|nr:hypothetical protein M427DRAFT_49282 [Gonapodya prolifera JEL478]|eukprot:KXS09648.1 hypothetical protein M427DRAFT_49282 [Gonapodya prolifera JEL478]
MHSTGYMAKVAQKHQLMCIVMQKEPFMSFFFKLYQEFIKDIVKLPVGFVGRWSDRITDGWLLLRSKPMGINSGSVLMFPLIAKVGGLEALQTQKLRSPLYRVPGTLSEISIKNPYNEGGVFKIKCKESLKAYENNRSGGSQVMRRLRSPHAFHVQHDTITLDGGGSSNLIVNFLPFRLGTHELQLHFSNCEIGEFLVVVEGDTLDPLPLETFHWSCKLNQVFEKPIAIPVSNIQRDHAIENLLGLVKTGKADEKQSVKLKYDSAYGFPKQPLMYKAIFSNPTFHGHIDAIILDGQYPAGEAELLVNFFPKSTGLHSTTVTLIGLTIPDIRVYCIEAVCIPDGELIEIDMKTSARSTTSKTISIQNTSENDWTVKAFWEDGAALPFFKFPESLHVRAHSSANYRIDFAPVSVSDVKCKITLLNMQNNQKHIINIQAQATEPLPDGTFQLTCKARECVNMEFTVCNLIDGDMEYLVALTLPHAHGPSAILIQGHWFLVDLTVLEPEPSGSLTMKGPLYASVTSSVCLSNPLLESQTFKVVLEGQGVTGEQELHIPPKADALYQIFYHPGEILSSTGKLKFINPNLGEYWWNILLEGFETPPKKLPTIHCDLGDKKHTIGARLQALCF